MMDIYHERLDRREKTGKDDSIISDWLLGCAKEKEGR